MDDLDRLEEFVDKQQLIQTQQLLTKLASNFNEKTIRQAVPKGTLNWAIMHYDVYPFRDKTVIIHLIEFFGMWVGYDEVLNIIVCWEK